MGKGLRLDFARQGTRGAFEARHVVAVALACAALAVSGVAAAAPPKASEPAEPGGFTEGGGKPLRWDPAWREFDGYDVALMGAAAGGAVAALVIGPNETSTRRGGLWFDESVRDHMRVSDGVGRTYARDGSDVLMTSVVAYPYLVDSLVIATWYRRSPHVGLQMTLIGAEAAVVTLSLQTAATAIAHRERPYGRECGGELDENTNDCVSSYRYRSFFSGHTSQSFAAAGVTCVFHAKMPLYGEGTDWVPCAASFTLASATGALRIASDQHYATDVITGAVIGSAVGIGLPLGLHFRGSTPQEESRTSTVDVMLVPTPSGVRAVGVF